MNRIIFVDEMNDRREIRIADDNMAETFYNGESTGKFNLNKYEIIDILLAKTEDEAFEVIYKVEHGE
jgi:hypothetical protein